MVRDLEGKGVGPKVVRKTGNVGGRGTTPGWGEKTSGTLMVGPCPMCIGVGAEWKKGGELLQKGG